MTETLEKLKVKKINIKIVPFINGDADKDSLTSQLANYGLVLNDGGSYKEQITCLEQNGIKRYLSGLDEFAPEVQRLGKDSSEQKVIIKSIRQKVVFLEAALGGNILKIDDPQFWNNVKTVHPKNDDFWKNIFVECDNNIKYLDETNPHDLVVICGIEAGGFSTVAKSYEDAKALATPPKFYLDKGNDADNVKVNIKRIKNEALASLTDLSRNNPRRLFYIIKNIDNSNSYQYKNSTSTDIIYDFLDNYVSGLGSEKSQKKAAIFFNEVVALSEEECKIKAVLADAIFHKMIATKADSIYYHRTSDTALGRNIQEIVSYLKDTMNFKIWEKVLEEVEANWIE